MEETVTLHSLYILHITQTVDNALVEKVPKVSELEYIIAGRNYMQ